MCIEFQHLSCQVVVIKSLAYLLIYCIAVVIAAVAWNQLSLKNWINFGIYWNKITFALALVLHAYDLALALAYWPWLGPDLDTSGLVNIPGLIFLCSALSSSTATSNSVSPSNTAFTCAWRSRCSRHNISKWPKKQGYQYSFVYVSSSELETASGSTLSFRLSIRHSADIQHTNNY